MKKALFLACVLALLSGCTRDVTVNVAVADPNVAARAPLDAALNSVYPALVRVGVIMEESSEGRMRKQAGSGSGAIISSDGYVITNHHVAGDATKIVVRLDNQEELDATIVGTDPMCDITILKLDLSQRKSKGPLPVARFGDSDKVRVGDTVLAMGSPAGVSQSVTVGHVSNTKLIVPYGTGLVMKGEVVGTIVRWIGHDAVIYPGNSGGPLVNLQGEIIGINEMGIGSLGGAIPSNLAKAVAAQLIDHHKVERSWIGLECQPRLKDSKTPSGVLVGGVIPDSPASKAKPGALKVGDIIMSFDGVSVDASVAEEMPIFNQLVLSRTIGKPVHVVVLRDGKMMEFTLTPEARGSIMGDNGEFKSWGMTALDFTRLLNVEQQRVGKAGVLVESIRDGGPCRAAKPALESGDIIMEIDGKKVENLAALRATTTRLEAHDEPTPALVSFERDGKQLLTVVRVGNTHRPKPPRTRSTAYMGVDTQVLTGDLAAAMKLPKEKGVRITRVLPNTAAQKAGLKIGDVLVKLDGFPIPASQVTDEEVFTNMIRQYDSETLPSVRLTLYRDGKSTKVDVKLEASPTPVDQLARYEDPYLELSVREMSAADRAEKKVQTQGVLIETIEQASFAALADLKVGDVLLSVDGKPVGSVEALKQILTQARTDKAKRLVFFVKRGVHTRYLQVEPNWGDAK